MAGNFYSFTHGAESLAAALEGPVFGWILDGGRRGPGRVPVARGPEPAPRLILRRPNRSGVSVDVAVHLVDLVANLHPGSGLEDRLGERGQDLAVDGHGDGAVLEVHGREVGDEDVVTVLLEEGVEHLEASVVGHAEGREVDGLHRAVHDVVLELLRFDQRRIVGSRAGASDAVEHPVGVGDDSGPYLVSRFSSGLEDDAGRNDGGERGERGCFVRVRYCVLKRCFFC